LAVVVALVTAEVELEVTELLLILQSQKQAIL
jgi:hypothetical protein